MQLVRWQTREMLSPAAQPWLGV